MTLPPTADLVIIGAGAIGCSTAWHLAQAGITDVVVVEMGQVGSGSSSKSASMLSLQFGRDETIAPWRSTPTSVICASRRRSASPSTSTPSAG